MRARPHTMPPPAAYPARLKQMRQMPGGEPCVGRSPVDQKNKAYNAPATEDGQSCPSVRSPRTDTSALLMKMTGEDTRPVHEEVFPEPVASH